MAATKPAQVENCEMSLQCEAGSMISRETGLKSCIPRKSQAAQAPSKVWAITCACFQPGVTSTSGVRTSSVVFLSAASGTFPSFGSGCALFPLLRSLTAVSFNSTFWGSDHFWRWPAGTQLISANAKNQNVPATMTSCHSGMPSLSSGLPQLSQQPSQGILTPDNPCPLPGFLHPHLNLGMNIKILYCHFVIYLFWSV